MSLFSLFSKKPSEPTSVAEALAGVSEGPGTKTKSRRAESRQSAQQDEQLIPEKKRARRRLIGAVAIVLAVVIGLPMVLDSEPKPLNKNILIQIPSKDSTISAGDQKQELLQEEVVPQSLKPTTIAEANTAEPSVPVLPASTVQAAVPKSGLPANTPAKPEVKADKKPDHNQVAEIPSKKDSAAKPKVDTKSADIKSGDTKSTDKHVANGDDAARAIAILNGADTGTKSPTRIVVQVGAFATQEKVNELQEKLNSAGIKSFTQKVATSSGDKIRLRIGPFADKESADKMKMQLVKLGLNGSLISL